MNERKDEKAAPEAELEVHDMQVDEEVRGGVANLKVVSASKLLVSGASRFSSYTYTT